MNKFRMITLAASALFLVGCATFEHAPKEYQGPVATLLDWGYSEDRSKAQLFAAMEIDGNRIYNAFIASARASHGQGNMLTTMFPTRRVKAIPMKVSIKCSHATGAPIAALASQANGTFFSTEGIVDFKPEPNRTYIVKGELKKEKSTCWIEDFATGKAVTTIISN
jgi:hypothetical protein